jgi:hypothetical protein
MHFLRKFDHVSHLETSVMGAWLADYARIELLSFLYKVFHVGHPYYLFRYFFLLGLRDFAVPAHRCLAMSQSFVVLGLGLSEWSVTLILLIELIICFFARVLFLWHPPLCWMLL